MSDDAATSLLGSMAVLFSGIFLLIALAFAGVVIASMWMVFSKAGKPGWAALIPIYNTIVLLEIVGKPLWWIFLLFIPLVNMIIFLLLCIDLAKSFGRSPAFGIGLVFLGFIFFPILAFGSSRYLGPLGAVTAPEWRPAS